MGDDLSLPERKAVRTPMQWTADANGGFSTRRRRPELPVVAKGPFGYQQVNVADQRRDPRSLLNLIERLIRTRKECPEFGWGEHQELPTGSPNVLAVRCEPGATTPCSPCTTSPRGARAGPDRSRGAERPPLTNLLEPTTATPTRQGRHRSPAALRLPLVPGRPAARRGHARAAVDARPRRPPPRAPPRAASGLWRRAARWCLGQSGEPPVELARAKGGVAHAPDNERRFVTQATDVVPQALVEMPRPEQRPRQRVQQYPDSRCPCPERPPGTGDGLARQLAAVRRRRKA